MLDSLLVFLLLVVLAGRFLFEKRRPRRIVPRMLAKGASDTKDVTRTRDKDASLNRRGRDSPEVTWIRPRLLLEEEPVRL